MSDTKVDIRPYCVYDKYADELTLVIGFQKAIEAAKFIIEGYVESGLAPQSCDVSLFKECSRVRGVLPQDIRYTITDVLSKSSHVI